MGEVDSLWVALTAIYLLECVVWVPRGSLLLVRRWGQKCSIQHPGAAFGNARGAVLLAHPFPPFGAAFQARPWLVSLSAQGVLSWTAACLNTQWRPPVESHYVRFDEVRSIETRQKQIRINGELFCKAASSYAARIMAGHLRRVQQAS